MSPMWLMALLAAPSSSYVVASSGEVLVDGSPASAGARISVDAQLSTGDQGWVEVWISAHTRLYVGAGCLLRVVGPQEVSLRRGRVWVLHSRGAAHDLRVGGDRQPVLLEPGASAIVERITRRGFRVAQGRGRSKFAGKTIKAGHVGRLEPLATEVAIVLGGQGLFELVANERRSALQDPTGLMSFLRREATNQGVGKLDTRSESLPSLTRGDQVEATLRPPPFFEDEVPPRGPNVNVTVTYEE